MYSRQQKVVPFHDISAQDGAEESIPRDVIARVNEEGYMDEALMLEWIRVVWNRQLGALLRLPSMLVLDALRRHLTVGIKQALGNAKTDLIAIPGTMTSTLQPFDFVLNKLFKDWLRELYNEWIRHQRAGCEDHPSQPCQTGCPPLGSRYPTTWSHERLGSAP